MSNADLARRSAVIFGCSGERLGSAERSFFRDSQPLGFILFGRNCRDPQQVRALVEELRATVDDANAPVLIDQEGGRVQRLGPPHWEKRPTARTLGEIAKQDRTEACEAAWLAGRLIAADLEPLGITVDCAPVLDVPVAGSHDVIGDRAFAGDAEIVSALGRAFCEGLLDGGVLPVVKHVPGHGRARVDSHVKLPDVDEDLEVLRASDFWPFIELNAMPLAMTAHILYRALDAANVATLSRRIVEDIIRGEIGFKGVLISDDISMGALPGRLAERTRRALDAGCDLILHCNGGLEEMKLIASEIEPITPRAIERWHLAEARRSEVKEFDCQHAEQRLRFLTGAEKALALGR